MTRPMTRIHNIETNEVIDREMNDEEFAAYEKRHAEWLAIQNQQAAKEIEKAALLEKLGITADEAALLLS
jgi:hypothetical protein